MPICTLTPIVRIFEDFDKMSAKEVYYNDLGDKITVKLLYKQSSSSESDVVEKSNKQNEQQSSDVNSSSSTITTSTPPSTSSSSSSLGDSSKTKRPHRKLSDGRKRSSSNLFHKCSKAFAENHTNSIGTTITSPISATYRKSSGGTKFSSDTTQTTSSSITVVTTSHNYYLDTTKMSSTPGTGNLHRQILTRRSPSPTTSTYMDSYGQQHTNSLNSSGYAQYQMSLLEVPLPRDYGDASSDDLSSEWDSDVPPERQSPKVFTLFFIHNFLLGSL